MGTGTRVKPSNDTHMQEFKSEFKIVSSSFRILQVIFVSAL